jgi:hypothetical protein
MTAVVLAAWTACGAWALPTSPDEGTGQAQADIQRACDAAAAGYLRGDMAAYLGMFDPSLRAYTVDGRSYTYAQMVARYARPRPARPHAPEDWTYTASVGTVALRVGRADVRITWHMVMPTRTYTYTRDETEDTVWVRRPAGWREVRVRMTDDVLHYRLKPPPPLT